MMTNHTIVKTDSGGEKHWLVLRCKYCNHVFEAPKTDTICPKCNNAHTIYCGSRESPRVLREIAEVWPPATFIVEEMKARKWNNSTLSRKSGRTTQRIKELLAGAEIGLNDADGLGRAFGTSKVYWLNLQDIFTKSLKKELHEQAEMKELTYLIEKVWKEYSNLQDEYRKLTGKEHVWLK
jgi:plasmid maintenance system antidote protein VapI